MGKKREFIKANHPYFISVFFLIVTLIKLILLCVFYHEAVDGVTKRLDSFVDINRKEINWGIIVFALLFGLWFIFLCLADLIAMARINDVDLSKFGCIAKISCIGSYCSVSVLSVLIRLQTILWAIVLTIIGILATLGIILIKATNGLCNDSEHAAANLTVSGEISNNSSSCIDLRALEPAVQAFTDKPTRLIFCDAARTELCSHKDDDLAYIFFHCFMVGLLVLIGLMHFLINMVGNKNRYHQLRSMRNTTTSSNDLPNVKAFELATKNEKLGRTA